MRLALFRVRQVQVGEVGGSSGFIDGVQTDHHAGETAWLER